MFEVSPNSSHAVTQAPSTPLVDCLVNDTLLQTRPCFRSATSSMGDNDNMNRSVAYYCWHYPTVIWLTIGLLCRDFISNGVLYAIKMVAKFYTVQYVHIIPAVVGCAHVFITNFFRYISAKNCQNRTKYNKDIIKIKREHGVQHYYFPLLFE